MSEIGEALGTAVEGGLFARMVGGGKGNGPKDGQPLEKGHFAEDACLNCGTALVGAHCHSCGQQAHLHRTIGAFLHDLLHGALHFDGKTWRTLPMLMFKPGALTRRYIEGERARFVSPMGLFLFSIFLMFAVFQLAGISTPTDIQGDTGAQMRELAASEIAKVEERQASLEQDLEQPDLDPEERQRIQQQLVETKEQLDAIHLAEEQVPFLKKTARQDSDKTATDGPSVAANPDGSTDVMLDEDEDLRMNVGVSDIEWIDNALDKWRTNPGLMLYKLQTNFYKFSWLLIPLSVPFVWLLFAWKWRFGAYDHAIFVTYSLSFMTLLTLAVTLLGLAGAPQALIIAGSLLIPPIHIYKHLRGAYGLSRFSALWRLSVLSLFIMVVLLIFLQLLLLLGAF
ncbi:DUF3667 domain-containing protein [Qipengyuania gaetbuli]|uniref:DUF3667 domain-containing protein n=1 Tax=Qipengyuania gaetbuli TaxID=266952 RepID=UPI001C993DE7|nr:DUF3667 domain-containing protein [Qipengyuania gaetbuli]MBY6015732.1 DUF3667 domain-containing protein [Qipengyuania gaetbuli]